MLTMYLAVICFAWYTGASAVIKRDQWHYVTMLTEYFDTGFDFHFLTLQHGEHLQLGYNLWFFLNGLWFGLNTQLELFIGLFCLGGFLVILYREFGKSLTHNSSPLQRQMMFLPMLMVGLSFHQIISFTYSMLSFVVFIGALLMMLFVSSLNKYLIGRDAAYSLVPFMAVTLLLLGVSVAGSGWVVYLGAGVTTIFSWVVTHRPAHKKIIILAVGLLVLIAALLWINSFGDSRKPPGSPSGVLYVFEHLNQVIPFVLIMLANSILDINLFQRMDLLGWVYGVGGAIALLYVIALYLFYKTRMWEKTYVPLYLISYVGILSLALLVYRFPVFGVMGAAFPRYATSLQLGWLGVLWVVIYWSKTLPKQKAGAMWFAIGLMAGVPYFLNLYLGIQMAPYIRNAEAKNADIILNEEFDERSIVCPNMKLCRQGVATLKNHRLNVYNKNRNEPAQIKDIAIKFKKWGPQSARNGIVPNAQPNGHAGLWFQLEADPGLGKLQVYFDGKPVVTYFRNLVITASIPPELLNQPGARKIVVRQVSTGRDFEVGEFAVLAD